MKGAADWMVKLVVAIVALFVLLVVLGLSPGIIHAIEDYVRKGGGALFGENEEPEAMAPALHIKFNPDLRHMYGFHLTNELKHFSDGNRFFYELEWPAGMCVIFLNLEKKDADDTGQTLYIYPGARIQGFKAKGSTDYNNLSDCLDGFIHSRNCFCNARCAGGMWVFTCCGAFCDAACPTGQYCPDYDPHDAQRILNMLSMSFGTQMTDKCDVDKDSHEGDSIACPGGKCCDILESGSLYKIKKGLLCDNSGFRTVWRKCDKEHDGTIVKVKQGTNTVPYVCSWENEIGVWEAQLCEDGEIKPGTCLICNSAHNGWVRDPVKAPCPSGTCDADGNCPGGITPSCSGSYSCSGLDQTTCGNYPGYCSWQQGCTGGIAPNPECRGAKCTELPQSSCTICGCTLGATCVGSGSCSGLDENTCKSLFSLGCKWT